MTRRRPAAPWCSALVGWLLIGNTGYAQPPDTEPGKLPKSLLASLDALGASSGVPDGVAAWWYPSVPVGSQRGRLQISRFQLGLTAPVLESQTDGLFATASVSELSAGGFAVLRDSRTRLPANFWDVQSGGAYLRQLGDGQTAGFTLSLGTASDQPFSGIRQATANALAFYRWETAPGTAWMLYVVSATSGQVGNNIPIPGLAYEFDATKWSGVVGFPFLSLKWRPADGWEGELSYAALTDVYARLRYELLPHTWVYGSFAWANQSWFREERRNSYRQLFLYEKRWECGLLWQPTRAVEVRLGAGYAFDRYFTETVGFALTGRNRIDLGATPYAAISVALSF